ncbi:hypothetical protein ACFYWX_24955 [Streptomyces sp. NPDC002888]|uniref:hypothetical protein n=1 Tax=Streptomyces sp. NPDC002888 TaxID=3364668 RepID=UPI0036A1C05D
MVILGDRVFDGPVDHVALSDLDASRAATRHLIERGCRRIAILCGAVAGAEVPGVRRSTRQRRSRARPQRPGPRVSAGIPAAAAFSGSRT